MKIPGLKRLRLSARWLRSRLTHGALILGYHRIAETSSDPFSLAVSPEYFADQLACIRTHATPMSLRTLVHALKDGKVPRRAVVLTFDDGYADNLYAAKPLLERYEVPATVFVATGYLGVQFWWDELARIVLTAKTLPEHFSVKLNGNVCEWRLLPTRHHRFRPTDSARRKRVLSSLQRALECLPENDRRQALEHIRAMAGALSETHSVQRALSPEEVLHLAHGNLLEVGAHTVSHPILATLPLSTQKSEILQSKNYLEELLDQPVTSFSYPHGSFSGATVTAVRETGYACACTSLNDVVWSGSDCFQLPRFWVANRDGASFGQWLNGWLSE
jgi:peptidoglycan/xylan/chitin deacetylase (PgdA/CDA1 family)